MEANTTTRPARRRGPIEGEHVIGIDAAPDRRPGVPLEGAGRAVHAPDHAPARQPAPEGRMHRTGLDALTPVFGTAQPPHGLSGALRRAAYARPEHYARHWLLMMFADRVDVLEDRVGSVLARPFDAAGLHGVAHALRDNPLPILAGAAAGVYVGRRMLSDGTRGGR